MVLKRKAEMSLSDNSAFYVRSKGLASDVIGVWLELFLSLLKM